MVRSTCCVVLLLLLSVAARSASAIMDGENLQHHASLNNCLTQLWFFTINFSCSFLVNNLASDT